MTQTISPKRAAQIHAELQAKAAAKAKSDQPTKESMTTSTPNTIPNFEHAARDAELLNAVANAIEPFLSRAQAHKAEEVAEAVLRVIRGDRS